MCFRHINRVLALMSMSFMALHHTIVGRLLYFLTVVPLDLAHPEALTDVVVRVLIVIKRNSKLVSLCEPSSDPFINSRCSPRHSVLSGYKTLKYSL